MVLDFEAQFSTLLCAICSRTTALEYTALGKSNCIVRIKKEHVDENVLKTYKRI